MTIRVASEAAVAAAADVAAKLRRTTHHATVNNGALLDGAPFFIVKSLQKYLATKCPPSAIISTKRFDQ